MDLIILYKREETWNKVDKEYSHQILNIRKFPCFTNFGFFVNKSRSDYCGIIKICGSIFIDFVGTSHPQISISNKFKIFVLLCILSSISSKLYAQGP